MTTTCANLRTAVRTKLKNFPRSVILGRLQSDAGDGNLNYISVRYQ